MLFDELGSRVTAEYGLFLLALNGRYQQLRAPGAEVTPRAISDLRSDAYALGRTFLDTATGSIDAYLHTLTSGINPIHVSSFIQRRDDLIAEIRGVIVENVHQLTTTGRTGLGDIGLLLNTDKAGAIGHLMQRMISRIEFKTTDRAGRKWNAEKLMRVIVRDFAYQAWIDKQAIENGDAGHDLMQTQDGRIFSLKTKGGDYPHLAEVRHGYFHINSTATMVPYVPS